MRRATVEEDIGEGDTGGEPQERPAEASDITDLRRKGEGDTGGESHGRPAEARRNADKEEHWERSTGDAWDAGRLELGGAQERRDDFETRLDTERKGRVRNKRVRFAVHLNTVSGSESGWSSSSDASDDSSISDEDTEESEDAEPLKQALYGGKWRELGLYLESGCSYPLIRALDAKRRKWIKQQIGKYFVRGGRLYKRQKEGVPLLVIDNNGMRKQLLTEAHDDHGHRGRDATYGILAQRFWWETLRLDCAEHVASCHVCQKRQHGLQRESMRHAQVPNLFERFNLDIVDLGPGVGPRRYMVVARDAFTGWPEARLLPDKTAASVRSFVEEELIARYGAVIRTILTDNGTENASETAWLIAHLGFQHAHSTPYNPEGNSEVERGHATLVEGLLKASYDDRLRLANYLPYILWADRITTRRTTGYSPFYLVYGQQPTLPMDVEFRTYLLFDWNSITSSVDLLAARTRQLKRRVDDLELARLRLERAREQGRTYADDRNAHRLRDPLRAGQLVIVSNPTHSARGQDRWLGPYRVKEQFAGGSYRLEELNGVPLRRNVAAKHLKRYFARAESRLAVQEAHQDNESAGQQAQGSQLREERIDPTPAILPLARSRPAREPLPLPRARISRPALPHRDIPPTQTMHPTYAPEVVQQGVRFPPTEQGPRPNPAPLPHQQYIRPMEPPPRPILPPIRSLVPSLPPTRLSSTQPAAQLPMVPLPEGWVLHPAYEWGFCSQ